MHDCAPVALHCKVVELPLVTLVLFAASVTAGFAVSLEAAVAVLPVEEPVVDVSADDSPQAASAANTAHPSAQPNTRPTKPISRLRDFTSVAPTAVIFLGGASCSFRWWDNRLLSWICQPVAVRLLVADLRQLRAIQDAYVQARRELRIEAKAGVRDSVARAQCRAAYLGWNAEELILRQVPGHSFGRESGAKGKSQQWTEAIGGGRSDEVQARHR